MTRKYEVYEQEDPKGKLPFRVGWATPLGVVYFVGTGLKTREEAERRCAASQKIASDPQVKNHLRNW